MPGQHDVDSVAAGRRERNMQQKRARILDSAASLFAEHGFAGVTTQEISDRADVATGTLFRYAPSKGQLLLMVYNEKFRHALAQGRRRADALPEPSGRVQELIAPLLVLGGRHPGNMASYQRELQFGPGPQEPQDHRAEGLALVAELEADLTRYIVALEPGPAGTPQERHRAAAQAARSVFAVVHLGLAQAVWHGDDTTHTGVGDQGVRGVQEVPAQVAQILRGYQC